ncbi:hypothetical protein [Nocardia sp. NPDC050793]|uniref:hypothetical protein n=1 Tax=Nocardia sp. NPDC050793 TaxID=3155159 RepID=UPI0033CF9EA6
MAGRGRASAVIVFGWVVAIGLPLAVTVGVIAWPERIPKDRTACGIRERIEREDTDGMKPDASRKY